MKRGIPLLIAPALTLALTGCGKSATDASPAILTTVGLHNTQLPTSIKAAEGTFALTTPPGGLKRLTVNDTPWTYHREIGSPASPIEANDDLHLVGTIELPKESVAWAIITGGTVCPATHVLVSIKDGMPVNGSAIPGCDDRGTMRRVGDHIVFDVGGSTGTYRDGKLTLETNGGQGGAQ